MPDSQTRTEEMSLILAAEECPPDRFSDMHTFSTHDKRIVRKLMAHGPVLLQGGRGSGKSALMIAASLQMAPANREGVTLGLYVSLRYVPLLQASGDDYERLFCGWVSGRIRHALQGDYDFPEVHEVRGLRDELTSVAMKFDKRVVLLFDDAAHIGRESSLGRFFDIFRTLSSELISCKAAIYPGVTEFGTRFDVYNDATLVDVVRSPEQTGFGDLFHSIMTLRYPVLETDRTTGFDLAELAKFMGAAVLGNVRGFIYACNYLVERAEGRSTIGYNVVGETMIRLAADYYWPLLEEVKPKLGRYIPAVGAAQDIAERVFDHVAANEAQDAVIHRNIIARYTKSFEILEYAGFIARREASRSMKSGGRGPRYSVNMCNLFERVSGSRMTSRLFDKWMSAHGSPVEFHDRGAHFQEIAPPIPMDSGELEVFTLPIDRLRKSKAYPYGLTDAKIESLHTAGVVDIGDLAKLTDVQLLAIDGIGEATVERIRSVLGQAIWM